MDNLPWHWIIPAAYVAIGIYTFFWIYRDAEFRAGSWALMAYPALILWPVMIVLWLVFRGEEKITEMASKQTYRDYKAYMRTKKDKDLFVHFEEQAAVKQKMNQAEQASHPDDMASARKGDDSFTDRNIENLINEGRWDEALAAAKEMRKVAEAAGEETRVLVYDGYIRRIEEQRWLTME